MESILTSIKKLLGITDEYTHFDQDIIMHINTAFMVLNQLGVGPKGGFSISDDSSTWDEFIGESLPLEAVKTYTYLKVRMIFDPPTGSVGETFKATIHELECRLLMQVETESLNSKESED